MTSGALKRALRACLFGGGVPSEVGELDLEPVWSSRATMGCSPLVGRLGASLLVTFSPSQDVMAVFNLFHFSRSGLGVVHSSPLPDWFCVTIWMLLWLARCGL
jgi:hypothetical protein